MAANGTPQGYLSTITNKYSNNNRDRSMEQNYTNSGNPDGYVPDNRYIPPSYDPSTGRWSTQGLQYSVPQAYGQGQAGMPTAPGPMPIFNPGPYHPPQQQQQPTPQMYAAAIGQLGAMPAFAPPANQTQGSQQPPADLMSTYGQLQFQQSQNMLNNQLQSNGYLQQSGLGSAQYASMPQFAQDTYMQQPTNSHSGGGGYANMQYTPQFTNSNPAVLGPVSARLFNGIGNSASAQPTNGTPQPPAIGQRRIPQGYLPNIARSYVPGGRVRGTELA